MPEDKVREVSQQKKNGKKVPDLQYQKHHCTKFEPCMPFNFRSFCIDVSCGLVTCLARRCSEGVSAKKVFAKKVAFVE